MTRRAKRFAKMIPDLFLGWLILLLQLHYTSSFDVAAGPPLLNGPVFSLSTLQENDNGTISTNMNIVTYASPVSIRPERLWVLGIYKETKSYENFVKTQRGILQLLTEEHIPLVRLLGGSSGRQVDKQAESRRLGVEWQNLVGDGHPLVLPGCKSYVCLELLDDHSLMDGGSHDIAICRVTGMFTDDDDHPHLETQRLRDLGIITEQGRVAD